MKEELIGNNMKGQITLEILISLFILVASISAAVMVSFGNQSTTVDTQLSNQALYIARQEMETARGASRQDFNSVVSSSSTEGIYSKEVLVENIDAYTKKVTSRVSWETEVLRPQKIELLTFLTNFKSLQESGGDSGGGGLSGDWKNPRTLGSVDLGPGNESVDLDVLNKIVYLAAQASDKKKPDFYIIDATDGEHPLVKSNLNTGPGLNALDVAGQYVYLANRDADAQLQIINASDLNNPVLIKSYKLPNTSDDDGIPLSIFYASSKIYLGMKKNNGPEFNIIDVSNPNNPVLLGSYEINDNVNDIYINSNRAYLATDLGGAGLIILDVSNSASASLLGQAYSADTNSVFNDSSSLTFLSPGQELHIANTANPNSIIDQGSINVGDKINDIARRGYLVFLATSNSNRELQIINISDPASPALWSFFNFSQIGTGIDYEDNIVYISVRSNDALRIVTSSP